MHIHKYTNACKQQVNIITSEWESNWRLHNENYKAKADIWREEYRRENTTKSIGKNMRGPSPHNEGSAYTLWPKVYKVNRLPSPTVSTL